MVNQFEDRFVQVGNIRTRYWQHGEQGRPLLLIHGLRGAVEYWAESVAELAKSHQVYCLDLMGFGQSDKPAGDYSIFSLAEFVRNFMAAVGLSSVQLLGHSLGGGVSIALAVTYPHLVEKLVLVSSAGLAQKLALIFRLLSLPGLGEYLTLTNFVRFKHSLCCIVYDPSVITEEFAGNLYRYANLPGAQRALLATIRHNINLRGIQPAIFKRRDELIHQLVAPTLIIWGRQDPLVDVSAALTATDVIPHAKVEIFEECGHIPQLEHRDRFNATVSHFLAEPA